METIKETVNSKPLEKVITSSLSPQERIRFLANLIIDRILEDQNKGEPLRQKFNEEPL
jgi:hypothetical protein